MIRGFICVAVALTSAIARAEVAFEHPYRSVAYQHESQADPPQQIFVAEIDLTDPNVRVRVSRGGPDPDGEGEWQTTLMRPTKVADREGFDVVINGDFFGHLSGKDAEGAEAQKEFRNGIPAKVLGPAETDGKVWALPEKRRPAFVLDRRNHPSIGRMKTPPASAYEVVAGSDVIVKDGKNVAPPSTKPFPRGPHPRTAVGYKDHGKTLILLVVDGRKKGVASGMSLEELGDVMLKLGAEDAINLDGGGSSMMGIRNPKTGKMEIMNHPSDGVERAVGSVLGVSVKKRGATTRPT